MRAIAAGIALACGAVDKFASDEESGARLWVPIHLGSKTRYFNPVTSALSEKLPAGGRAAPAVSFTQVGDDDTEIDGDDDQQEHHAARSVAAIASSEVVQSETKSCYPRCSWNCTKPICNQDCLPECEQPKCQTRCPRPDYSHCKIDCQTPHCSVFCPQNPCSTIPGTKCSSPKCSTQCSRPVCKLACKNRVPCQNVCHPPRCTWNCRNPKVCAKPECKLVCEKPLGCAQNYELPPLSPSLTVESSFTADRARWVTYDWSSCAAKCGKSFQTRRVVCSTGEDHECQFAVKPATQQECEDLNGCNQWKAGEWSKCSATCGRGEQTREVTCPSADENECLSNKPTSVQKCRDSGAHCTACNVEVFGSPDFAEWQANFGPGEYDTDSMVAHGAKCEEISSVKIHGACCRAKFYQYGDFNQKAKGWSAELGAGEHDVDAMEEAGIKDNDASAMKVYLDESCHKRRSHGGWLGPTGGGTSGNADSGAEEADEGGSRAEQDRRKEERLQRAFGGGGAKSRAAEPSEAMATSQLPWWGWLLSAIGMVGVVSGAVWGVCA